MMYMYKILFENEDAMSWTNWDYASISMLHASKCYLTYMQWIIVHGWLKRQKIYLKSLQKKVNVSQNKVYFSDTSASACLPYQATIED